MLHDDMTGFIKYSVKDLMNNAHDEYTFNKNSPAGLGGTDFGPQDITITFVEFWNAQKTIRNDPLKTGPFPGPYTLNINNLKQIDGTSSKAITTARKSLVGQDY